MRETRTLLIWVGIVIGAHVACHSAAAPSSVPAGYAGQWSGTTAEGTTVQFSVSAANEVTSFVLTYRLSATCAGTLTYTDLAALIHTLDPPEPPPFDQPGFAFSTNDGTSGTAVAGHFSPDRRSASGDFVFVYYGACGTVMRQWIANRR